MVKKIKYAFIYELKNIFRQMKRQYELPSFCINLIVKAIVEPLLFAGIAFYFIVEQNSYYYLVLTIPVVLFFDNLSYICKNIKKARNLDTLRLLGMSRLEATLSFDLVHNFSGFLAVLLFHIAVTVSGCFTMGLPFIINSALALLLYGISLYFREKFLIRLREREYRLEWVFHLISRAVTYQGVVIFCIFLCFIDLREYGLQILCLALVVLVSLRKRESLRLTKFMKKRRFLEKLQLEFLIGYNEAGFKPSTLSFLLFMLPTTAFFVMYIINTNTFLDIPFAKLECVKYYVMVMFFGAFQIVVLHLTGFDLEGMRMIQLKNFGGFLEYKRRVKLFLQYLITIFVAVIFIAVYGVLMNNYQLHMAETLFFWFIAVLSQPIIYFLITQVFPVFNRVMPTYNGASRYANLLSSIFGGCIGLMSMKFVYDYFLTFQVSFIILFVLFNGVVVAALHFLSIKIVKRTKLKVEV